jgi:alcohol dehydrogenase class IV
MTSWQRFDYVAPALTVLFGAGRIKEADRAVELVGGKRALVLSTRGHRSLAADVAVGLGGLSAGIFAGARMHTPVTVSDEAMEVVIRDRIDCLVSVGGGSTIGLGKAIALRTGLPQVAIPTTYAGSEMTDILGETRDGAKVTQRTAKVRPRIVIYDVDLTMSLPSALSAASGMNAIAHAVEALYAKDGNPVVALMAEEGIRALASSLPVIVTDLTHLEARTSAQYGAWLCGLCLGSVSMALHHKLCHVLGGAFDLPHAETHAIVLPHAAAYNAAATPQAMGRVARALGCDDAPQGLFDLIRRLRAPTALKEIGMPQEGIDTVVESVNAHPYWNPRPPEREALRNLVTDAYFGRPPRPVQY